MSEPLHYVIIGTGAAGNEAAWHLRQRDAECRITMVTAARLLFIRRYELPKVFDGVEDWRELLVYPPEFYDEHGITVRRNSWVTNVDPERRVLGLRHKEEVSYDRLLVASGGGGYIPAGLSEYRHLLHRFATFGDAIRMRRALPDGGRVIMLGADMTGLDLARKLTAAGYRLTVVATEQLFWPHEVSPRRRTRFVKALEAMGVEVIQGRAVAGIEAANSGGPARRVVLDKGDLRGDVVIPFFGLMPTLDFMVGAGVDIERGLLVNPQLATTDKNIWAAGDVCQIWSPEENRYRFYYGWKNVKMMGRIAALNMTGGDEAVDTFKEDDLFINADGEIDSPFWEYD
jgi:NAD(P)H-nitrite reductase large subunit